MRTKINDLEASDMTAEIVRTQLAKTIKSKTTRVRELARDEEMLRRQAADLQRKRQAIEAEVAELDAHLTKLGGPVEVKE